VGSRVRLSEKKDVPVVGCTGGGSGPKRTLKHSRLQEQLQNNQDMVTTLSPTRMSSDSPERITAESDSPFSLVVASNGILSA
jgi:hypothetical protein